MKKLKRETVIDRLTENEVDTCMNDVGYLYETLRAGCVGFAQLNNEQLRAEWFDIFNEQINVK